MSYSEASELLKKQQNPPPAQQNRPAAHPGGGAPGHGAPSGGGGAAGGAAGGRPVSGPGPLPPGGGPVRRAAPPGPLGGPQQAAGPGGGPGRGPGGWRTTAERLAQAMAADHVPENDTIGRLRGAIVNLDTTRKAVEKARAERDDAPKPCCGRRRRLNESPFAGQTAESALKEAAAPPSPRPLEHLARAPAHTPGLPPSPSRSFTGSRSPLTASF